jgi:hypothetical protein
MASFCKDAFDAWIWCMFQGFCWWTAGCKKTQAVKNLSHLTMALNF